MTINASYVFTGIEEVPVHCFVFKECETNSAPITKYFIIIKHYKVNYMEAKLLDRISGLSYNKVLKFATKYRLKLIKDF